MATIIPLMMSAKDVTNQQLYDLIQSLHVEQGKTREEMRQQFKLVNQKLDFHDQRIDLLDQRFDQLERDVQGVRKDVSALQDMRLRWNGGILAWVTLASSALTLIALRLLSAIGLRVVEGGGGLV